MSASWRQWRQGLWWPLVLVALVVITVGVVALTVTHAGTVTTLPSTAEEHLAAGGADGTSTLSDWGWEWYQDLDPGSNLSPTHLR